MPRTYVDNASNRSLGRVGMPVGSMVVSRGSSGGGGGGGGSFGYGGGSSYSGGGGYSGSSSSTRTYVDNSSNRSLGRVGMPVGSMVVSRGSSGGGDRSYSSGGSTKTYVDNSYNRSLGRVGLEHGTAVASKGATGSSGDYSSGAKTYVDNAYNRRLDRIGLEHGTAVVSKGASERYGDYSSGAKTYVDNAYNRKHDRVGLEHGTAVVSKSSSGNSRDSSSSTKTYVDNSYNRSHDRVGKVYGTASVSRSASSTSQESGSGKKTYVDNAYNRQHNRVGVEHGACAVAKPKGVQSGVRLYKDNYLNRKLGRVGMPVGTAVYNRAGEAMGEATYADTSFNRKMGRVGLPRGSLPVAGKSKKTTKTHEIARHLINDSYDDYSEYQDLRGDDLDALENALNFYNRQREEESWQKLLQKTELPKTLPIVLEDFSGTKIQFEEIEFRRKIGQGGFGEVYFAKWNGSVVAVKKLKCQQVSKRMLKGFTDEILTFCDLDHANIVKFIGACVDRPNLCIVMEYMQMSLYDALHVNDAIDFEEGERQQIMWQTSSGLQYLHEKNIAHCDLKTQNVLMDYTSGDVCVVKITDFGLSMIKKNSESSTSGAGDLVQNIGTPRYSAPEVLRGEYLSLKEMLLTDVYSLGLIMYEVIYEEEPFYDLGYAQLRRQVGERGMAPTLPDVKVEREIIRLMSKCWSYEPAQRPTAGTVCRAIENQFHMYVKTN